MGNNHVASIGKVQIEIYSTNRSMHNFDIEAEVDSSVHRYFLILISIEVV